MAARRLVIVMLVLLGISALAAALVPTRESDEGTVGSSETATTTATGAETTEAGADGPDGANSAKTKAKPDHGNDCTEAAPMVVTCTITVGGRTRPIVSIQPGEQLDLIVRSKLSDQVEIPALGLISTVAPAAPARFNLLPEESGDLGVRLVEAGRVVARIEVRSEAREGSARAGSKSPPAPDRS
jgi:hypothetical protein